MGPPDYSILLEVGHAVWDTFSMTDAQKLSKGIYLRRKVYWLKFQVNGKRRYISLETEDPLEAMRRASEMRSHQFPDQPTSMTKAIEAFLAEKHRLNIYGPATARVHGAALREFAKRVEGRPLDAVSPKLAGDHYAALQARVSETTAQIHIRALKAFFNWCLREKLTRGSHGALPHTARDRAESRTTKNPFSALRLARIDQPARLRYCTAKERDALLNAAPTPDLAFIFFCGFHAGMRKNEIIEARVGWFDLKGLAVHLQNTDTFRLKDREARTVPLTHEFAKFLKGYLRDKDASRFALRPDVKHGKGTYRYDFHRPFNDFLVSQEKRWVTAHVMRHTFASLLTQAGVSIYKVARWLGDGVEVVEAHYGHLAPKDSDIERMK